MEDIPKYEEMLRQRPSSKRISVPNPSVVGIPWFDADEYEDVRCLMSDAASLPERWPDWLSAAERQEHYIISTGFVPVRACLSPRRFQFWCMLRGLDLDAAARQRFATEAIGGRCRLN